MVIKIIRLPDCVVDIHWTYISVGHLPTYFHFNGRFPGEPALVSPHSVCLLVVLEKKLWWQVVQGFISPMTFLSPNQQCQSTNPNQWLHPFFLLSSTSTACISTPNMVRHDICRHNYAVERGLVVGFCGQPHYCNWPYYLTARFQSPSSYVVFAEPFPDMSRPMSCKLAQMGSRPITFLWLWPASDHEPHCRHVPINTIWMQTEPTPRCRWRRAHIAATAVLAQRKILSCLSLDSRGKGRWFIYAGPPTLLPAQT